MSSSFDLLIFLLRLKEPKRDLETEAVLSTRNNWKLASLYATYVLFVGLYL